VYAAQLLDGGTKVYATRIIMALDLLRHLRDMSERADPDEEAFYSCWRSLDHVPAFQRAIVEAFVKLLDNKETLSNDVLLSVVLRAMLETEA
jgi:hypothetical protein